MKRTFVKRGLMSLVAGFFLFGVLMLTAVSAQAQSGATPYTWKGSDQAVLDLEQEVASLYNQLSSLQPGSANYNNKLAHALYYRVIRREVNQGSYVSVAVNTALDIVTNNAGTFSPADGSDMFNDITVDAALRQQMKNNAINLLTL